ncbi:MAG: hypothetical protein HDS21_01145 [Bacteroides sp.]|nr:hypothetical protein [Bacteroides sp.]
MKSKILILTLLFFSCTVLAEEASAQLKKVAVYIEGEIGSTDKSIISSAVLGRMSGNKEYAPFERNESFVGALTKEHDFQLSGEVADEEIRNVGNRLGVDYVVAVSVIISRDNKCHMSAKLINIETGAILKTVNVSRQNEDSSVLTTLANNIAYRLLNKQSK